MLVNNDFRILSIKLKKFAFEQSNPYNDGVEPSLSYISDAKYKKEATQYDVVFACKFELKQKESLIFSVDSVISTKIETSENFDKKYLHNIVAIMYSYLRPMVAQVTVMAKLPPLDIPPMNFSKIVIGEVED